MTGVAHLLSIRLRKTFGLLAALTISLNPHTGFANQDNGFDLSISNIPRSEILHGGPPRDGIPALSHPEAEPARDSAWNDSIMILGLAFGQDARAYPMNILTHHELVNDTLGGKAILISYFPLCGTGMVFERRLDGKLLDFGVSGLLYRSDLLMYDRQTESLWSQIEAKAVTGTLAGKKLTLQRSQMMNWGRWRKKYPNTTVMSRRTGHTRNYDRLPYGDYARTSQLYFPVPLDPRYHPKLPTLGLRAPNGEARAYPSTEVLAAGGRVEDNFEGRAVQITYDEVDAVFHVQVAPPIEVIQGYWFAWMAFHPKSSVYRAPSQIP